MATPNRKQKRSKRRARQRIIGYVRVSTDDQAEHGISLAEQRRRVKAYATAHELQLVRIAADNGKSGKTIKDRPGLVGALQDLKDGRAGGLVVCKLDRLSRTARDMFDLVEQAERDGWQLHSIEEHLDTSSPGGRFVLGILSLLAQMEREQVSARTKAALNELRHQGKRTSGRPPFGYKFGEHGRLLRVPLERNLLRQMQRLHAQGLGALRITNAMNEKGSKNPRTGRPWGRGTVAAILKTAARRSA